jgi:hypothetical protein
MDDADAVLSYRSLPRVSEWIGAPPEDFPARFAAPERPDLLLIVEREGATIGDLMVRIGDAWAPPQLVSNARGVQAELGWALRPRSSRRGARCRMRCTLPEHGWMATAMRCWPMSGAHHR